MGGKDKSRPKCSSPAEGGALSAAMVLPKARAFGTAQRSLFGMDESMHGADGVAGDVRGAMCEAVGVRPTHCAQ